MKKYMLPAILAILSLAACNKNLDDAEDENENEPAPVYETVTEFTDAEDVFGFQPMRRYSYCPSVVENQDGTSHVFFCGNPQAGNMVDNVYHIVENGDGTHTEAVSVLQPSAGSWDSHHTCDPSVIEGEFKYGGVTYRYAMFYLGASLEYYYNEVGVAFANSLDATYWVKYPDRIIPKTWESEGDLYYNVTGKCWGCGQPSAVSLDGKGQVLLTFTVGDLSGTRLEYEIIDFSDVDNWQHGTRKKVPTAGIVATNGTSDWVNNADFAICPGQDKIIMVRDVHPHPNTYPDYIATRVEVLSMPLSDFLDEKVSRWQQICYVSKSFSGFARNHNAGLSRDSFGHTADPDHPYIYYTVSKASPDVTGANGNHAEWSYHIYKTRWITHDVEVQGE